MVGLGTLCRATDPEAARKRFERAAEAGHVPSMRWLAGQAREQGDRRTARRWYQRAADAGDARAMYWLAVLRAPCLVAFDLPTGENRRTVALLEEGARLGDAYAQPLSARQLSRWDPAGIWTPPERLAEVRSLLHQAADQGLPRAMHQLANIASWHDHDEATSDQWVQRAAEAGSIRARYMLALREPTAEEAQRRLDEAAELDG